MRRRLPWRVLSTLLLCATATASSSARADLTADVRKALAAIPKATAGVQIVRLGQNIEQDQTLVSIRGDDKFIPASNLKIITTALALETLGPDFRFRTRLALNASGDIALIGDGDPTFGDSDYLEKTGWTPTTVFENWAKELKKAGVNSVQNVLVDDSIFDEVMFQPNWPTNQAHKHYVAQVAGMNLNANCLDVYVTVSGGQASVRTDPSTRYVKVENTVRVGGEHILDLTRVLGTNRIIARGVVNGTNRTPFRVTIDDPAVFAATTLAEVLAKQGIKVQGAVKRDRTIRGTLDASATSNAWRLFAAHETPLMPVLEKTNKDSVNLYAESLGKRSAAKITGQPGSWKLLGEAQSSFMKALGVPADDSVFDDGCGLSKVNAVAPAAFVATLRHFFHHDLRERWIATMAIGGADGTLSNRYKSNGLAGRVFAKSGSVTGVSTLSGYLNTKSGEWYAFSILINNTQLGAGQAAQDAIVKAIDESTE